MHLPSHVHELEARYIAVFQGLRENRFAVREMTSPWSMIVGRRRLNRCLQRLDYFAEHLRELDEDLGRISRMRDTGRQEYIDNLSKYSELLELGTRVYTTLYREYKEVRRLRETLNFLSLATAAAGVALAGVLLLLL